VCLLRKAWLHFHYTSATHTYTAETQFKEASDQPKWKGILQNNQAVILKKITDTKQKAGLRTLPNERG
jgi:hypothetical protein